MESQIWASGCRCSGMNPDELMRKTAAAVADERITPAAAEKLLGFIAGQAAGFPPPSASTWQRRARELRALGMKPPDRPELFRFDELPGAVRQRRRCVGR